MADLRESATVTPIRPGIEPIPALDLHAIFNPKPDLYERITASSYDEEPFGDVTLVEAIGMLLAAAIASAVVFFTRPRNLIVMGMLVAAYFGGQLTRVML